jgi:hypothetical protein
VSYITPITVPAGSLENLAAVMRRLDVPAAISDDELDDGVLRARVESDGFGVAKAARSLGLQFGAGVSIGSLVYDARGEVAAPVEGEVIASAWPRLDGFAWLTDQLLHGVKVAAGMAGSVLIAIPSESDTFHYAVTLDVHQSDLANSGAWRSGSSLVLWRAADRRGFLSVRDGDILSHGWDAHWSLLGNAEHLVPQRLTAAAFPHIDTPDLAAILAEPGSDEQTFERLTEALGEPVDIADIVEGLIDPLELADATWVEPATSLDIAATDLNATLMKRFGRWW